MTEEAVFHTEWDTTHSGVSDALIDVGFKALLQCYRDGEDLAQCPLRDALAVAD